MASKIEFVEFMADQLREAGTITYKKMFGEYGLYCNGKIFAVICDDHLYQDYRDRPEALPSSAGSAAVQRGEKLFSR